MSELGGAAAVPVTGLRPLTVRLLGSIRVDPGPGRPRVRLAGPKPRVVLAGLGLRVGRVVAVEQIIDDLWTDRVPATARNTVQVYVSAVRRALEAAGSQARIESESGGYRLTADREQVDWFLFEALTGQARQCLRRGDLELAATLFRDALELWEGPPLADVEASTLHEVFAPGMEAARSAALIDRFECELALGRVDLVPELTELVARHPLDERYLALLIRALHRTQRRAEALAVYAEARRRLVDQLGVEPGARLQQLHLDLLREQLPDAAPAPVVPVQASARPALPAPPGRLIGRDRELAELAGLLAGTRLVTLTGPPGVGKSRLAAELGHRGGEGFRHGVWLVHLDGIDDPELVARVVLQAVGGDAGPGATARDQLRAHLLGRRALLVLDRCEHLHEACAALVRDLADRPGVRVLATSTRPLGVDGERLYRLDPLPVPGPEVSDPAEVGTAAAVRLFLHRARAVRPDVELTEASAAAVARICRVADGLPLALELAAHRMGVLGAVELADLLTRQFETGPEDGPAGISQAGLEHALAAGYDLLGDGERRLFGLLCHLRGGFTLAAAQAVAAEPELRAQVLDLLQSLSERSLVIADPGRDPARFRILNPVRQYGVARAREARDQALDRLLRHLLAVARQATAERHGPRRRYWQQLLDAERGNLHLVLDWAVGHGRTGLALELVAVLWWWWFNAPAEGLRWYRRVITAASAGPVPATPAQLLPALLSAAVIASFSAPGEALEYGQRVYAAARAGGDRANTVRALHLLSDTHHERGELDRAASRIAEALELLRDGEDDYAAGQCRIMCAHNHFAVGDAAAAREWADLALASFRRARDVGGQAEALLLHGELLLAGGQREPALALIADALAVFRRIDRPELVSRALVLQAWATAGQDGASWAEPVQEAFDLHLAINHAWGIAHDLQVLAVLLESVGRPLSAATVLGAVAAVREQAGLLPSPRDREVCRRVEACCRDALGAVVYGTAERRGGLTGTASIADLVRQVTVS